MNIQKDWKAKLESAYSFMLKYSKITVCLGFEPDFELHRVAFRKVQYLLMGNVVQIQQDFNKMIGRLFIESPDGSHFGHYKRRLH